MAAVSGVAMVVLLAAVTFVAHGRTHHSASTSAEPNTAVSFSELGGPVVYLGPISNPKAVSFVVMTVPPVVHPPVVSPQQAYGVCNGGVVPCATSGRATMHLATVTTTIGDAGPHHSVRPFVKRGTLAYVIEWNNVSCSDAASTAPGNSCDVFAIVDAVTGRYLVGTNIAR